jgi:hypothetical protein
MNRAYSPDEKKFIVFLGLVLETLAETGKGIEGHLYAALMSQMDLSFFNSIVAGLVRIGAITKRGHVLTITDSGRETAAKISAGRAKAGV